MVGVCCRRHRRLRRRPAGHHRWIPHPPRGCRGRHRRSALEV